MYGTRNSQLATKVGFTLVELSIVIVIIGLLIGGILVGQSLISSAKINSLAKEITQYSIAAVNFKLKFKQHAGDSTYFTPGGNGDGIHGVSGSCPASYVSERVSAWQHLSDSGMLSKKYTYSPTSVCGTAATVNCTGSSPCLNRGSFLISKGFATKDPMKYEFIKSSNLWTGGWNETRNRYYSSRFQFEAPPEIFVGLDKKLDASNTPDSGSVVGGYYHNDDGNYAACNLDTNSDYYNYIGKSDTSGVDCYVAIQFAPHQTPEMPITN